MGEHRRATPSEARKEIVAAGDSATDDVRALATLVKNLETMLARYGDDDVISEEILAEISTAKISSDKATRKTIRVLFENATAAFNGGHIESAGRFSAMARAAMADLHDRSSIDFFNTRIAMVLQEGRAALAKIYPERSDIDP